MRVGSWVLGPSPQWYGPPCPTRNFFKNIEKLLKFQGFVMKTLKIHWKINVSGSVKWYSKICHPKAVQKSLKNN